jgi:hypothetical protein
MSSETVKPTPAGIATAAISRHCSRVYEPRCTFAHASAPGQKGNIAAAMIPNYPP